MKKLITHDGSFHTDDIFACATLIIMLESKGEQFEVIRTRDEEIIKNADYVFDVGGVYDEEKNRFDHHQIGGAGRRVPSGREGEAGIEYASFGLVWKKFGEKLSNSIRTSEIIEKRMCLPIDAWDNGFDLVTSKNEIVPYYIQNISFAMHPTWREEDLNIDEMFLKCVEIAKVVLAREIVQAQDMILAEDAVVSFYKNSQDKRIIVLDKNYPFEYILFNFPEPLFGIYPRKTGGNWGLKAIRADDPNTFKNRKDLPTSWAGLRDEELQQITGVSDAVFCHRALFLAAAKSKEGAIKLAQIALES